MKSHLVKSATCPTCGKVCNGASSADSDDKPKPGDFSVCIDCQGLHVFDQDMQLRHPTENELLELPLPTLQRYQSALSALK